MENVESIFTQMRQLMNKDGGPKQCERGNQKKDKSIKGEPLALDCEVKGSPAQAGMKKKICPINKGVGRQKVFNDFSCFFYWEAGFLWGFRHKYTGYGFYYKTWKGKKQALRPAPKEKKDSARRRQTSRLRL